MFSMMMIHQPDNFPDFMSTLGTDKSQRHSLPVFKEQTDLRLLKKVSQDFSLLVSKTGGELVEC